MQTILYSKSRHSRTNFTFIILYDFAEFVIDLVQFILQKQQITPI